MREIVTTLTQKGQVTIPAEVRRLLGLRPRDKVAFILDGEQVRIAPAEATLEAAFGAVKPLQRPEDFKKLRRIAREERASRAIREMGK